MKKRKMILDKIKKAKADITTAEGDLEKVLREMRTLPRAEKTTVSKPVGDAFDKLRAAKANLNELEAFLLEGD
jgi:hypothetical protein